MKWISTRGASPPVSFIDALFAGTAPDGGLYMPERLDPLPPAHARRPCARRRPRRDRRRAVGAHLLRDEITPAALAAAGRGRARFPDAARPGHRPHLGARAVSRADARVQGRRRAGAGAAAAPLHRRHAADDPGRDVRRHRQRRGAGVPPRARHARRRAVPARARSATSRKRRWRRWATTSPRVAVRGTFDDCQRLVKQAFADDDLRRHVWLTPANSINLGRLLPQVFYYFLLARLERGAPDRLGAERQLRQPDGRPDRQAPRPAGAALRRGDQRQRRRCPQYLRTGRYEPRPSVRDRRQRDGRRRAEQLRAHAVRSTAATSSALRRDVTGVAYDDARVVDGDRRRLSRATATCSIRTARSPGWRCRRRWRRDPDGDGRVPGHRPPGEVPRGRRAGDRRGGAAAGAAGRGAGAAAPLACDMAADYHALRAFLDTVMLRL